MFFDIFRLFHINTSSSFFLNYVLHVREHKKYRIPKCLDLPPPPPNNRKNQLCFETENEPESEPEMRPENRNFFSKNWAI